MPQRAFCFSRLHAQRLEAGRLRGEVTVLRGAYVGPLTVDGPASADNVVVFAGRHIPEKGVPALVPAIARARQRLAGLRAVIYGDGPEREQVLRLRTEHGLEEAIAVPGFVEAAELERAFCHALCMVLPSRREGYGMVVIEAAREGTPSVVVEGPDNAAVELVSEGENGFVARSAAPEDLADAIVRVHDAGPQLRRSTAEWFRRNAEDLSIESSLRVVLDSYGAPPTARR